VGVDPGTRDRHSDCCLGWSSKEQNIYQVHEWVTPRNSNTHLSDIAIQLKLINERFRPIPWWYMIWRSAMAIDTFSRDYGIPIVHAAKKVDASAKSRGLRIWLAAGRCKS